MTATTGRETAKAALATALDEALDMAGRDPAAGVAALETAGERRETPCGGGAMVWRAWGDGAPLLLVHGGHGSWTHWIRVIPRLARGRRVIACDLPGFGDSAPLPEPDAPLGPADEAERYAATLEAGLGALIGAETPLCIAAFSFGSVVSARLARRLGTRARGLAIIGAPGLGPPPARPRTIKVRGLPPGPEREAAHRANLVSMMLGDAGRVDALALHLQERNVARTRAVSRHISRSHALIEALPDVRAPLVAIYGERDAVCPQHAERAAILAALGGGAVQHVLPGVGHWAPYEAPEAVAAILKRAEEGAAG